MDLKIIDYAIADGIAGTELVQTVNDMIEKGWQPLGGFMLAIDAHPDQSDKRDKEPKFNLGQAMVRYETRIHTLNA